MANSKLEIKKLLSTDFVTFTKERDELRDKLLQGVAEWNLWRQRIFSRIVDMRGFDLNGANLEEVELRGAILRGSKFNGANLGNADLRASNLIRVEFQKANLAGAHLEEANLGAANLEGALLKELISQVLFSGEPILRELISKKPVS